MLGGLQNKILWSISKNSQRYKSSSLRVQVSDTDSFKLSKSIKTTELQDSHLQLNIRAQQKSSGIA
jgi:hypothetical protein